MAFPCFSVYPLQWWYVSCYSWHPGKGNVKQRDDAGRKAKPECLGSVKALVMTCTAGNTLMSGESFFSETGSNKMQHAPQKGRKLPNLLYNLQIRCLFSELNLPHKAAARSKPTTPRSPRTHLPKQVSRDVDPTPWGN